MTAAPSTKTDALPAGSRRLDGAPLLSPAWLIATFLGVGRLPAGSGTWASAATVLLWWAITHVIALKWQMPMAVGLAALAALLGIPAATRVARESHNRDPSFVVIDEVAGQMVALIAVPVRWKTLLVSFILFRVFDIWKPPPLRQLERFPEGTGIMLDDLGAGLYALAVMHLILHLGWL